MPVWLLTGIGAARNVAKGAFTWITANTTHLLAVILAISALWGLYERHEATKYHRALDSCSEGRKSDQAEWKRQVAAANAATAKAKQDGKDAAHDADTYHAQLVSTTDAFDRWRASHRVQPATRSAAPASPGSGDVAYIPPVTPAVPAVAVSDSDLANWKANADYAQACYEWGQGLIARKIAN